MSLKTAQAFMASLPLGQRRRSRVMRWHTAMDNYEPTREYVNGHAVTFTRPDTGDIGYVLFGVEKLRLAIESVYVVEDPMGTAVAVTAMYPVAWHGVDDEFGTRMVLHPYATGGYLTFGPKRSYHIKLSDIK